MHVSSRLVPVLLLSGVALAACASDDPTGPLAPVDRADCTIGTLTPGATREFTLGGTTGCRTLDIWQNADHQNADDTVRAASYTVRLGADRMYAFRAVEKDVTGSSGFDLTAALFGPGADTTEHGWLTASDDEWGSASGYAPVLYVIPSVAGNYAVRVAGYDAEDSARVVVLSTAACPIGPTIDGATVGTTTAATLTADGCVASPDALSLDTGVDSTRLVGLRLTLPAGVTRRVRVVSTAFHPTIYVGGPGPDLWGSAGGLGRYEFDRATATDTAEVTLLSTQLAGTYTLLVGAAEGLRSGGFTVLVDAGAPALSAVRADRAVPRAKRSR